MARELQACKCTRKLCLTEVQLLKSSTSLSRASHFVSHNPLRLKIWVKPGIYDVDLVFSTILQRLIPPPTLRMAKDSEAPKSIDKGKGKATDGEASKSRDVKKDEDGKPLVNGKGPEPATGGRWGIDSCLIHANTVSKARISVRKINNSRTS